MKQPIPNRKELNNEQEPQEHPQRSAIDEERDYLVAKYCNDEED